MGLLLGETAPDFEAESTHGRIKLHEWMEDKWALFFSYPADFTPVCATEIGAVAELKEELDKRGAKALAVSADALESHQSWVKDVEETQSTTVNFPLVADPERKIAELYGLIHPKSDVRQMVRATFVIDPQKRTRASLAYPPGVGRGFAETLRLVDALQLVDAHPVATPADWSAGDEVLIAPALTNAEAERLFPKGFQKVKPYLRTTPNPED